ncbi:MAG: hypothetical protein JM58_19180 [Peptococcaceae bacterium BICA1-8]|nr:MAG: hypothetical protein JM58_19180 [Peptococcaceae bacterium BICA1-8]
MSNKRPKGIAFIGYFYIFGAVILLISLGTKQDIGMAIRFGVPNIPETAVRVFIAIVSFILAMGYLKLRKWAYWSMIIYSLLFLVVSMNLLTQYNSQPFLGNAIWSAIVLIYTYIKRDYFRKQVSV